MDRSELSEEEYQRRKAEVVAFQNKKKFSNIFILVSNIFLIIETFLIIALLMVPLFAIFSRFDPTDAVLMLFEVLKMVLFIVGLFLGFFVFRKVINVIIRKKHLEDKLTDSVKKHYLKKTKEEIRMEQNR